jgi:hypothetical protein
MVGLGIIRWTIFQLLGTTHDVKSENILLDIIELANPVHDGASLCEKLLEVIDRLGITCSIISITRDNASSK